MIVKSIAFATLILGSVSTGLLAQQSGTPQERRACSPDVKRFCSSVINQGDIAMLGCLQQNRPSISRACNKVLLSHGQ
jgi:hypothetical protein